jgi:uncharacterized protein (TIGR01777 family)
MKKLVIPGGSGYLGRYLAQYFEAQNWDVVLLTRGTARRAGQTRYVHWDGKTLGDWAQEMNGATAVVNLAGRSVNCRYNAANKAEILNSRLDSTRIIGHAIAQTKQPPEVWINSSSATIYEDTRGAAPANNEYKGQIGDDFSMNVCKQWEASFEAAAVPASVRKIALRASIVISQEPGGAMEYILNLTKLGLGGKQGSGQQYISWIHLYDFGRVVDFLIHQPQLSGIINAAAPQPVTNQHFMATLRQQLGCSWGLPANKALLEIGALFLKTQTELILKSRKVVPKRLEEAGFEFEYPTIEQAFAQITA